MKDQKNEAETNRIQREFEVKARDNIANQKKEVAAMKEKLQERLKRKRERKIRKGEVSNEADQQPDIDDSEMRMTLNKEKVKQLAYELNNKLSSDGMPQEGVAQPAPITTGSTKASTE